MGGLVVDDTAFRFLEERLGYAGMQRRAERDVPVWWWETYVLGRDGSERCVSVGPGNRVVSSSEVIADSAVLPTLPLEQARALAER